MKKHNEAPIFYDDKGRRWKHIRRALVVLALVVGAGGYVVVPQVLEAHKVTPLSVASTPGDAKVADSASGMSPSEVAAVVSRTNTPVIGKGPLVRVVHIQAQGNTRYAV